MRHSSHGTSDANRLFADLRVEAQEELGIVNLKTKALAVRAISLCSIDRIPQFLMAMGYHDRPYTITVNGRGFTVALATANYGQYFPKTVNQNDWLIIRPDGETEVLSATEYQRYWERDES